ncbi:acyltransferase, partial [Intestinimonas butyriciproducens]|nr:acyltransferase [Intestinimonas butyriciproducens]
NLHIVDWYAASAEHDNWLTADKTHPTTEGQLHYVATVAKAVLAKSK